MKALKKISYSEDVDILVIQLSNKKVDDAYDLEDMIVSVAEDGEPVLLEIFNGSKFLKNLKDIIPAKIQKEGWTNQSLHQIKK